MLFVSSCDAIRNCGERATHQDVETDGRRKSLVFIRQQQQQHITDKKEGGKSQ
jgi:hypothetical protein